MMAMIVGSIILIIAVLLVFWLFSPSFRTWAEKPKYTMLERNQEFERAAKGQPDDDSPDNRHSNTL